MRFLIVVFFTIAAGFVPSLTIGRASAPAPDTHSRNAEPDYRRVFSQDVVNRLDIRMAPGKGIA
jgi:hypothetical protein